jgi:phage shock protein E
MFFNNFGIENISPDQLNEKMGSREDFFLLDVRTPAEHAQQAIPGSYLIPLQELGRRMRDLPRDREIVVYCRVGSRSAAAGSLLARHGYNVKNLEGGLMLWNMAGNVSMTRA